LALSLFAFSLVFLSEAAFLFVSHLDVLDELLDPPFQVPDLLVPCQAVLTLLQVLRLKQLATVLIQFQDVVFEVSELTVLFFVEGLEALLALVQEVFQLQGLLFEHLRVLLSLLRVLLSPHLYVLPQLLDLLLLLTHLPTILLSNLADSLVFKVVLLNKFIFDLKFLFDPQVQFFNLSLQLFIILRQLVVLLPLLHDEAIQLLAVLHELVLHQLVVIQQLLILHLHFVLLVIVPAEFYLEELILFLDLFLDAFVHVGPHLVALQLLILLLQLSQVRVLVNVLYYVHHLHYLF